jgi:hypothetical protein
MKRTIIQIQNDGPALVATDYWDTQHAAAGLIYASCNGGTIRLLLPPAREPDLPDMTRGVEYVILSRGPWPEQDRADAFELLFEDHSDSPYALRLSPESFDLLPCEPELGSAWRLALWVSGPRRVAEYEVRYRRVPALPWLKPWATESKD